MILKVIIQKVIAEKDFLQVLGATEGRELQGERYSLCGYVGTIMVDLNR